MIIATVREIKTHEYRVGLTPACVRSYVDHGHTVLIEAGAGDAAGFPDDQYTAAGGQIVGTSREAFDRAEMIVKVKEPLPREWPLFHEGQILYTYLHLAAFRALTVELMERGVTGVAYETIEAEDGFLPCLTPMSAIAGRMAVQEGAKYLEKPFGGRGVLLSGVPGVERGKVTIIGAGVVGTNACKIAVGMGAEVNVLDVDGRRLAYLDDIFGSRITTLYSTEATIAQALEASDVIIGAVLVKGGKAPHLIRASQLASMPRGAVIVDVAVDQGGCAETTRPTSHDDPIYVIDGVVHYCVANIPGAVAYTSTRALTSTTLRYGLQIADLGIHEAARRSPGIAKGINTVAHRCVYQRVADDLQLEYTELHDAMEAVAV